MSGSKTITGIALSNTQLTQNAAPGTEIGTISVTTGDGTAFSGTLQLSGPYATYFTITATLNPYSISSVTLSNAALAANPPVGTVVGTISVARSDGAPFTGSLSIDDTTHFTIVGAQLRTASSLTNGTSYPLTITATDPSSTNQTLTHNYSIPVGAAAQVPGPLTSLASPTQTTTSITVTWAPPTTGGALDNGVHQLEYKTAASGTYLAASPAPYCTPSHGSITDAFGNTWSLNAAGRPVINTTITNDPSTVAVLYLVNGIIWQFSQAGTWFRVTTTGALGGAPAWQQSSTTGLSLPIIGLVAATTYNVRGYATNSTGGSNANASAPINVATSSVAVPAVPTGVSVTAPTSTTARVFWQTPAGTAATGYIVQYKRAVDANYTNAPSWLESVNGTTCTPGVGSIVTGTTPPQTYAINASNNTTVNGTPDGGIGVLALYWAHNAYHQNSITDWYLYNGTPNSYTFVGRAAAGDPRNTIPADTTFVQVISGLVASTAYNVRVLAFNAAGNGPASTAVNVTTPATGPVGVQPPAAAVAAGYTNLIFFSDFVSQSELTNDRSGNTTAKWYTTGGGLSWTISNSILSLNNSICSYNADISSVANGNAPLTTPGATRAGNGNGLRFKYGCYEALMKIDRNNITGGGWIAWWASGFEGNVLGDSSTNSIEMDFFEYFNPNGPGSTGLWNWESIPITTVGTFATPPIGESLAAQYYFVNQAGEDAAAGNYVDWFIVGGVITPAKVEVYFTTKAKRAAGTPDTTIFRVDTTRTYNTSSGPAVFDASRVSTMQLLLGGSDGSPFLIDYVAAWQ